MIAIQLIQDPAFLFADVYMDHFWQLGVEEAAGCVCSNMTVWFPYANNKEHLCLKHRKHFYLQCAPV